MMKTLHKVNTMQKNEKLYSQKVNIHLFISSAIIQQGYMSFVQVVEMEPAYQKQNGHENLVPTPQVTSEVTSYQATC
jgi:hypothetical protein